MPVIRANQALFGVAFQAALGTAATAPKFKIPFAGGNIGPVKETDRLSETDASRDVGVPYVTQAAAEGSPEFYVRDTIMPIFLYGAIGNVASSAGPTNFVHDITVPASGSIPYLTFWRDLGAGVLWERFQDCQIGTLTISAEAGGPLTATAAIQGTKTTRLTATPWPGSGQGFTTENGPVYNYNQAAVSLNGSATAKVRSFELTIENNLSRLQVDDVNPFDVYVGTREVSLGFDLYFENITEYQKFYYEATGSYVNQGTTIYETTANTTFTFTQGTNNEISFTLPRLAYEEFPIEPDPGGDPIVSSVRAVATRGSTPVISAQVKNQLAGTVYAT